MQDIHFNPQARDIWVSDGDFSIASDTETGYQNGFILAGTPMTSPFYPTLGLSLVEAIGSDNLRQTLIRWANMAKTDGAIRADYEIIGTENVTLETTY